MPTKSETLLSSQTHPGDSTLESVTGDKYQGDGYYGRSDGLHTVQYSYTDFTGSVIIQATLAVNPADEDWFTVFTTDIEQESDSLITSFTGNFVWVRAHTNYTDGTLNSVILNH
jgi:hypothetical protein